MSLPSLAPVSAFKLWPGVTVADDSIESAEAVLDAASALVRRRAGRTWLNEDGSALGAVPDGVPQVVVAAAARFWNNPHSATIITRGPFTEQFAQAIAAGLYLTDDESATVLDASSKARPGIWTMPTTRDDVPDADGWIFDPFQGVWFQTPYVTPGDLASLPSRAP